MYQVKRGKRGKSNISGKKMLKMLNNKKVLRIKDE